MKKRVLGFVLTMALFAGSLLIPAKDAKAGCEAQVPLKKNVTIFLFPHVKNQGYSSYDIDLGKKYKGATKVKATSSKPSVLQVTSGSGAKSNVYLEARKTGKVKVTVKFKKGGKWYKLKSTVKIVKYESPFKSFKFGSKNIDKQLKKDKFNWYLFSWTKPSSKKLSIKMKKDWKIKKIQYMKTEERKIKTIKNNSKIKDAGSYLIKVTVENKKKNIVQQYYFGTWGGEACPF